MNIYQHNLDKRLQRAFPKLPSPDKQEDHLLIIHPPDVDDLLSYCKECAEKMEKNTKRKGILFVKGTSYGGLSRSQAHTLQKEYKHKIHFLSYAVTEITGLPPGYDERFNQFFDKIEKKDIIDWNLIDPTYPESIVAAVTLLEAARQGCSVSNKADWDSIYEKAVNEYNSRGGEIKDKAFPSQDYDIVGRIEELKKFLSTQ